MLRTLRGQLPSLILATIGLAAFETLIPVVFDALGQDAAARFLDAAPENVRDLMERQFGLIPTGSIEGWLGTASRHPIYLVLMCAVAVATASGAVAREVERKTILYVLTRPVSRTRFLLEKVAATLLALAVLAALGLGAMILVTALLGYAGGVDWMPFVWITVNAFLLFAAISAIATAASSMGSAGGPVIAAGAGVSLASYFIDFLAGLWAAAEPVGPVSLFHYYNPSDVLLGGGIPWFGMGVLLAVTALGYAVALVVFNRRDISA